MTAGDVITAVGGQAVASAANLNAALAAPPPASR
jgi:S1-C subfamily serine protease